MTNIHDGRARAGKVAKTRCMSWIPEVRTNHVQSIGLNSPNVNLYFYGTRIRTKQRFQTRFNLEAEKSWPNSRLYDARLDLDRQDVFNLIFPRTASFSPFAVNHAVRRRVNWTNEKERERKIKRWRGKKERPDARSVKKQRQTFLLLLSYIIRTWLQPPRSRCGITLPLIKEKSKIGRFTIYFPVFQ